MMRQPKSSESMVSGQRWSVLLVVASVALAVLVGCGEPLQHGLEESEANAMVVSLNNQGVEARKVRDPADDERWAVEVPSDQRVQAWSILQQEGFPRPEAGGFADFYPGGGLIPTAKEERVVLQYATAQELQASLLRVDGIIDAHVHLVLPEQPRVRLADDDVSQPRASVLVQWQRSEEGPPLDAEAIRQLVSGAVENLSAESVHVVMTPVEGPETISEPMEPQLARVGPVAVAPESQGLLRGMVLMMGVVIIALSSGLVYVLLTRRGDDQGGGA